MNIISNILGYFPLVGEYVQKTTLLYNQIAPVIQSLSKVKDCELYPPNSSSIKQALEESGDLDSIVIIEQLSKNNDLSNSFFEDDPFLVQNQLVGEVIQNLNSKFYSSLKNNKELLGDAILEEIDKNSISIGDPCAILEEDLSDAIKRKQKIDSDFRKVLDEDSDAFKILERCKIGSPLLESLKDPEIWTSEELQNVIDNCILPEDVPVGISNDNTNAPDFGNITENFEEPEETQPEGSGLDLNEILDNFLKVSDTLDSDDGAVQCAEKIFEASKILQESAEAQIKEQQIESDLKFDLEYETIFNEGIRGLLKGIDDVWSVGELAIGVQRMVPQSWKDYSEEMSVNTKKIEFFGRSARIPISFEKNKEKRKGFRFDIEEKFGKEVSGKTFKSFEEIEQKVEKKEKQVKFLFDSYTEISFNQGYDIGKDYGNRFISQERTKIFNNLKEVKSKSDDRLLEIQTDLDNIKKEREQREKRTQDIIEELNNLGCNSNERVATNIPDENSDFRGSPDPSNPSIHDDDYWKRFADLATIVGLLPVPQFTGSNDFKVQFNGLNASVKIPTGSPVIDDDGIPRFLFWPIGLPIPIPKGPDFLLRIPLPMFWKYLAKFELKNPIRALEAELIEKISMLDTIRAASFIIAADDPLDVAYSKLPNSTIDSIMEMMGISQMPVITFALQKISGLNTQILEIVKSEIFNYLRNNSFDANQIISQETGKSDYFINSLVAKIGLRIQSEIKPILDEINSAIREIQESLDFSIGSPNVIQFIDQLRNIVQTAEGIIKAFGSCFSVENSLEGTLDFVNSSNNALKKMRDITDYTINSPLDIGDFTIPFLKIDEYLGVSDEIKDKLKPLLDKVEEYTKALKREIQDFKENVSEREEDIRKYVNSKISEFNGEIDELVSDLKEEFSDSAIYEIFPKLKLFSDFLNGRMLKNFYNIIRAGLAKANFDFRPIMNLPSLSNILTNIPLVSLNFPDLMFVFFIGFSGPIPYPFLLCINMSNASVPGLIDARSMQFIVTADFKNPIKQIKKVWGSHTVPIKTQIEGVLNSSMGLGFSFKNGVIPNICESLGNLDINYQAIIEELIKPTPLFLKYLQNLPKIDIYNLSEWPNPNFICKMMEAQNFKEIFKKSLNSIKLKNSAIPPSFTKVKTAISNGLPNLNGKLKIDELKTTFDLEDLPNVSDILPLDLGLQMNLMFSEMGISVNAIFDLLPELSNLAPYVQDDLPPWERLHLGNVPFVLFLAEFLVAAKKGAKFPIPEVSPSFEML